MRIVSTVLTIALTGAAVGQTEPQRALAGRVVDVLGDPIPAARVEVFAAGRRVARTATDGEGIYHLPAAHGGTLRFTAPGKATLSLPWQGQTTARRRNVVLPDGARIHGRVVDAQLGPVANAPVVVVHGHESHHARTDKDGGYAFDGVALGPARIRAWRLDQVGFAERTVGLDADARIDLTLSPGGATVRHVRVRGLPADAAGAVVQVTNDELALLPNAGRVPLGADGTAVVVVDALTLVSPALEGFTFEPSGRICVAGSAVLEFVATPQVRAPRVLHGTLRSTDGKALADRELVLRDWSDADLAVARTDADGTFRAEVVLPANRVVRFGLPLDGFQLLGDEDLVRDGHSWSSLLDPGREIALWAEPLARLVSDVRDVDGTLLALTEVVVAAPDAPHRALVRVVSDRAGRCDLSLPDGDYELIACSVDGRVVAAKARVRRRANASESLQWQRVATGAVAGSLCDRTGAALAGRTIELWHEDARDEANLHAARRMHVTVRTDRLGNFRARGLPTGRWFAAPERAANAEAVSFDVATDGESRLRIVPK